IIIFSIIIYLLMTPLQIKQQKFSKLSAVMNPEIQKIQKKYQGKKDQESMQRMQEETQAVYAKYGVSATGSCLQMAILLPILWALWQVIYKIPAYVGSVKAIFTEAVDKIVSVSGYTDILQNFINENRITRVRLILEDGLATKDSVIDFLYSLSPTQWESLSSMKEFSASSSVIDTAASRISGMQNFLGLNIAEQPMYYIRNVLTGGSILLAIIAVMIPILSWLTQVINIKLMPTPSSGDDNNAMAGSMKTMNTVMPLMSLVFCFTFPVGLGIYWVSSAVVRSVQQYVINKQLDKIDVDELIRQNTKKLEEKRAKQGLPPQKITNQAHQSVRNINTTKIDKGSSSGNASDKAGKIDSAYEKARTAKPGSITAKANMVRDFNERNKKK
ncbi:MAG: membrane protein insertase YidC, partial [Blautia sp.]|nr:membrane protein insertase YidC [Blautia sp.]